MQKQKTLAKSFSMQGKGLHTGLDIQIRSIRHRKTTDTKLNVLTWKDNLLLMRWQKT